MATKTKKGKLLDLTCSFGGVAIGDKYARIGVLIDRAQLKPNEADKHLCGHRIAVRLLAVPNGDSADDERLFDDAKDLEAIADVKRYAVTPKEISIGLTFTIEDVDLADLAGFAQRGGKLMIDSSEKLPEEEKKTRGRPKKADEDEEEAEDHSDADL